MASSSEKIDVREHIARLVRLQGSDPGFFILALHSFIEAFLRDHYQEYRREIGLKDLIYDYREELKASAKGFIENLDVIHEISREHDLTNAVRHAFKELENEEARAATLRFLTFCELGGFEICDEMKDLEKSISLWDERTSRYDDFKRMNKLGYELVLERRRSTHLQAEIEMLQKLEGEYAALAEQLKVTERELEKERSGRRQKDARYDELRRDRAQLLNRMKQHEEQIDELKNARDYVLDLTRMTLYTRSRLEYERELVRLTPEQHQVLSEITVAGDFLVKGGAGTGKTLILLKALENFIDYNRTSQENSVSDLNFVLITYSETLVKYDRYIASIIAIEERDKRIVSVDEYLGRKLSEVVPGAVIDQEFFLKAVRELHTLEFMSVEDAAAEIEDFIFANNVTEREYCVDVIDRAGMKRRLETAHRKRLWELRDKVVERMDAEFRFSRNYSRVKIVEAVRANPELSGEDYMFVDEVQDLAPSDLMALKALSNFGVIMAGDNDQAIFRKGFSFKRVGIDIIGRSRTLKLNFRNTLQINELAEYFRERIGTDTVGSPSEVNPKGYDRPSQAFRPGPPPELFAAADSEGLDRLLVERIKTFLQLLKYEPETLTILVPDDESVVHVKELLANENTEVHAINDELFSFESTRGIRISPLHLAKGIDFSVVFLYLPYEPADVESYDEIFNETMFRNAIYVCMTRAMEHLNVFALQNSASPVIRDLINAFNVLEHHSPDQEE